MLNVVSPFKSFYHHLPAGSLASLSTTQTCPTWVAVPGRSCWAGPGASPSSGICSHRSKTTTPVNKHRPSPANRCHLSTNTHQLLYCNTGSRIHQPPDKNFVVNFVRSWKSFSPPSATSAGKTASYSQSLEISVAGRS